MTRLEAMNRINALIDIGIKPSVAACEIGVTKNTFYRWKKEFRDGTFKNGEYIRNDSRNKVDKLKRLRDMMQAGVSDADICNKLNLSPSTLDAYKSQARHLDEIQQTKKVRLWDDFVHMVKCGSTRKEIISTLKICGDTYDEWISLYWEKSPKPKLKSYRDKPFPDVDYAELQKQETLKIIGMGRK